MSSATQTSTRRDILGHSALRPDGVAKVSGKFEFSSDLHAENMLWGATLRSPHPYARIASIDLSEAYKIVGVEAIITNDDVPGKKTYGLIASEAIAMHMMWLYCPLTIKILNHRHCWKCTVWRGFLSNSCAT